MQAEDVDHKLLTLSAETRPRQHVNVRQVAELHFADYCHF